MHLKVLCTVVKVQTPSYNTFWDMNYFLVWFLVKSKQTANRKWCIRALCANCTGGLKKTGVEITKYFSLSLRKVSKTFACPALFLPVLDMETDSNFKNFSLSFRKVSKILLVRLYFYLSRTGRQPVISIPPKRENIVQVRLATALQLVVSCPWSVVCWEQLNAQHYAVLVGQRLK